MNSGKGWLEFGLYTMLSYDSWGRKESDTTERLNWTELLFNMLSRLIITFIPRNKLLLISWLQSPSAVILHFLIKMI